MSRAALGASPSGAARASLAAVILDGTATLAASAFNDARRLALRLHDLHDADLRDEARAALSLALNLNEIAHAAHQAAELAAQEGEAVTW